MKKKETIIYAVIMGALVALSAFLLKGDALVFWTWWLLALVLGILAMPLSGILFSGFEDKGWVFSKVAGLAIAGYLVWLLVSVRVLPFTTASCVCVTAACGVAAILLGIRENQKGITFLPMDTWTLVFREEIVFAVVFLIWTYLAGFNPAAYGTEKFMDYGFMQSMMRSRQLPAPDIWYSQGKINYYYGGQYFAVFMTKLSTSRVALTYNLMRTFVAGLAAAMSFSLVRQMFRDGMTAAKKAGGRAFAIIPDLAGATCAAAVVFAGNMHYVWYAVLSPLFGRMSGQEPGGYWFPDATRYIGYNPDVPDKTIHEFPCYSFVLGDLHAHVVNIIFVLLLIGILYAWISKSRREKPVRVQTAGEHSPGLMDNTVGPEAVAARIAGWMEEEKQEPKPQSPDLKGRLFNPWILMAALLLGLYKLNNYWDFVIYIVVASLTALFINIVHFRGRALRILGLTAAQAVWMYLLSAILVIPFTVQFRTMVDGIGIAQHHSLPYQLLILWGLPVLLGLLFVIYVIRETLVKLRHRSLGRLMGHMKTPDLFTVLLWLCALGLVLIPEIVYVRDIYENGNARANTMFKLTYQAYIMFGIVMGYGIWRLILLARARLVKAAAVAALFLLCWTMGYFGNCVNSWFGTWESPSTRQGLDASAFLTASFPEDVEAIYWLEDNVEGSPVVLEANGDSYTDYNRVSAMTGLPTILGWYVHEWLWRSDSDDLNEKSRDVEDIYTSMNGELVSSLLDLYDVSYIFVGAREREKYGDRLNPDLLGEFATVVFTDPVSGTCIYRVDR